MNPFFGYYAIAHIQIIIPKSLYHFACVLSLIILLSFMYYFAKLQYIASPRKPSPWWGSLSINWNLDLLISVYNKAQKSTILYSLILYGIRLIFRFIY